MEPDRPPPEQQDAAAPLSDASDSEIHALVDEVLRSGKQLTIPARGDASSPHGDRLHARAIARQFQQLADQLGPRAPDAPEPPDDVDEWWFEIDGRRVGPLSLRKVRYLWEEGELTPDSLCWHDGFSSWVSLFKVSELAEALAPRPPPEPSAVPAPRSPSSSGEWTPNAAEGMVSANRRRLQSTHSAPSDAPAAPPAPLEAAGTFATLPHLETAPPAPSSLRPALVGGAISGAIVAAALVGAYLFWGRTPSPQMPTAAEAAAVDEAITPPQKWAEPPPSRAAPPASAPAPRQRAPRPEPKPEPQAASRAPAAGSVDESFNAQFAPRDELTLSEVFEVAAANRPQIDACVAAHKDTSAGPGRLVMRWKVGPDGVPSGIAARSGDMANSELAACFARPPSRWRFPKHAEGRDPVDVPFVY